jgi:hypothetical protein
MRATTVLMVALGCCVLGVPAQSAPVIPHHDLSVSPITPVRQRCGQGMKRANATHDKQGAWHGPCLPKRQAGSGSNIAGPSDNVANQLNAQEAARAAGGGRAGVPAGMTGAAPR